MDYYQPHAKALYDALVVAKRELDAYANECGSLICEHDIGICYCGLRHSIEQVDAALKQVDGGGRPTKTRYVDLPESDKFGYFKHIKTGGLYQVLSVANAQAAEPIKDLDTLILYQSLKDKTLWVRPIEEFIGRFEKVNVWPVYSK